MRSWNRQRQRKERHQESDVLGRGSSEGWGCSWKGEKMKLKLLLRNLHARVYQLTYSPTCHRDTNILCVSTDKNINIHIYIRERKRPTLSNKLKPKLTHTRVSYTLFSIITSSFPADDAAVPWIWAQAYYWRRKRLR